MDKLFLIVAAIVGGLWFLRHLSTFNRRTCPRCKGNGRIKSVLLGERHRQCPRCNGATFVRGWFGRPE